MVDDTRSAKSNRDYKTANDVSGWDCAEKATERLKEMFVDLIQRRRIDRGQRPALRTVFLKQHGVAHGHFQPLSELADDMKVGVFAHGPLPCWVRFSSDTQPDSPDLHTTLGIGIKLFGVPGPKLLGEGDTADFILQNHDVFFVDNAQKFCEFTTAGIVDGDYPGYLKRHPKTARILAAMMKPEASCLTAKYWAILPFAFGNDGTRRDRYVKYKLEPEGQSPGEPFDDTDYLGIDLASRLRRGDARFQFMVQFRTDPNTMPLDQATVRWDSPWVHIADLVLSQQDIQKRGQAEYGQNLAFNIWRTPPEQEPQGSIAAARRVVYQGSADQRRRANGVSLTEPQQPATATDDSPEEEHDDCIVKAAIYPPIGVCRVGNSPELLARLSDPSPAHIEMRRTLKNNFRNYGVDSWSPGPWPWLYGDAMAVPAAHTPRQNCTLSDLQLWFLDQWVLGNFDADYNARAEPPRTVDALPVAEQPDTLTKAAMEFCLADAFHPGCEMTWPMRQPGMYMKAFRLKHRKHDHAEPSYGAQLNKDDWTLPDGPINGGQSPGSITRWMAVPWQTDTSSCRSGYDKTYDPYVPTFWPARVPNEVMSQKAYNIVMNSDLELSKRLEAFANRANWFDPLNLEKSYTHQINHMIQHFDRMGVVEVRPGLPNDPRFPDEMQVSDQLEKDAWEDCDVEELGEDPPAGILRRLTAKQEDSEGDADTPDGPTDISRIDKVRRFPNGLTRIHTS